MKTAVYRWLNGVLHSWILVGIFAILSVVAAMPCPVQEAIESLYKFAMIAATLYATVTAVLLTVTGAYRTGWRGLMHGFGWALVLAIIAGAGWLFSLLTMLNNFCGTF